jgi:O-antigen/teichoic acid export membrane protein
VAGPTGYLQGIDRVDVIAKLRLVDPAVRIALGLLAVLFISRSELMALAGFSVGGIAALSLTLLACRGGFPLKKPDASSFKALLRQSGQVGAVQGLLILLASCDAVAAAVARFTPSVSASYQAAALLGRIPLFASMALSIAAYTHLATARNASDVGAQLRHALRLYVVLALPAVIACWTVPNSLLHLLVPDSYTDTAALLRYTSLSGAALGLVNVLATANQARSRFRPAIVILLPLAVLQPILLVALGRNFGVHWFGIGLVTVSATAAVLVLIDARRWQIWARFRIRRLLLVGSTLASFTAIATSSANVVIWLVATVGGVAIVGAAALLPTRMTVLSQSPAVPRPASDGTSPPGAGFTVDQNSAWGV